MNKRFPKKFLLCVMALILPLCLSGCWDQVEIENRALVLGLAIDEAPPESAKEDPKVTVLKNQPINGKMIRVTAQIAVPGRVPLGPGGGMGGGGSTGNANPVWVVQVIGHTLDEALNNLQQEIADPRYLVHLRIIVINEEIAKLGLDELNDFLRRNPEVRRRIWLLVSDIEAARLMKVAPPLERVPTLYLDAMVEKAIGMGKFPPNYLGAFWDEESKWGQDGFLPYITIKGKENVMIKGIAYFSDGRLAGTSDPIEIGAYMAAKGLNPGGYSTLYHVPGIGYVMTKVTERHAKTDVKIVDGKPHVSFKIHVESVLDEQFGSEQAVDSSADIRKIERVFDQNAAALIKSFIRKTQRDHSDIFGIGEYVRAHYRSFWRDNIRQKRDWELMYADIPVDVEIENTIRRVGMKSK
ncbi:Ger(x)C family spore germination protein [Paenibacillus macerans]|uniref:Ger(x)C family spore germination protein n=1 Tax=Paenibacillus macerans TaxID=44252 RepID=UPI003D2C8859